MDQDMGRNIRRLIGAWDHAASGRFWEALPSPCRRCCSAATDFGGYSSALLHEKGAGEPMAKIMTAEFQDIIEVAPAISGITAFCLRCRAVTAISFEYDDALRTALHMTSSPPRTSGGHYAHIAMMHRRHRAYLSAQ